MVLDERTLPIAARALDARNLAAWRPETDAVGAGVDLALELAAERMSADGGTISYLVLRRGTLADPEAVGRGWPSTNEKLSRAVRKEPVIVR